MSNFGDAALRYANNMGLPVLPLRPGGKEPACPHGKDDATTNIDQICKWWDTPDANFNVGVRPPLGFVVLDIDPRNGGTNNLLEVLGGRELPKTWMSKTGSGGWHIWLKAYGPFRKTLCDGVDLKHDGGYVVMPPSIHPNGNAYRWIREEPIAYAPRWLVDMMRPPAKIPVERKPMRNIAIGGPSIADDFCAKASWSDVLEPHSWQMVNGDPTKWLHPNATSPLSASVRHDCLFVYSTNTPFKSVGEGGDPNGYTKFRAYAVLNHGGDMKKAAKALAKGADK